MENSSYNLTRIKELESLLDSASAPQSEIDALNELAWFLRTSDPERAKPLARKAIALAQAGDFESQPYNYGMASGLVTLAFVYLEAGQLQDGTNKCLEALTALGNTPHSKTTVRIWYTLAQNSFFLGDFPAALEHAQKALNLANQLDLIIEKAWALDVSANSYGISGDFQIALEKHEEALQIFEQENDIDGVLRASNNLAMTLYGMQDFTSAFEKINQSMQLAREWNRKYDMLNISCTAAQISIDTGQLDQAEQFLHAAFSNAEVLENTYIYHVFVMMEWARLSLQRNESKKARSYLLQAIVVAEESDQFAELTQCHKILADIYTREGNEEKALVHTTAYELQNEEVEKKRTANRLAIKNAVSASKR